MWNLLATWPKRNAALLSLFAVVWCGLVAGPAASQDKSPPDYFAAQAAYGRGDHEAAFKMWLVLARRGDVDAQFNVGTLYDNGFGVARDVEKAARWYARAADSKIAPAELALAHILKRGEATLRDDDQALRYLRSAAHRGSARAQFELGVAYERGIGVTQNYATTAVWYERAAAQGLTEAIYNLATLFDEGLGVPKDHVTALAWYGQAARSGSVQAENNIGNLYEKGLGVPQNYGLAVEWYSKAAKRGLAIAQNNLAIMHHLGHGVPRDFKQAGFWYHAAAKQGDQSAQNNLGFLLANGLGMERDLVAATKWFMLAAAGPEVELAVRASAHSLDLALRLVGDDLVAVQESVDRYAAEAAAEVALNSRREVPVPLTTVALGNLTVSAQRLLMALGYYDGIIDGLAGQATLKALQTVQQKENILVSAKISKEFIAALTEIHRRRVSQ